MFTLMRRMAIRLRDTYLVQIKWRRYAIGKNFHAGRNVVIWAKKSVTIGDYCYIGRNSQIECNIKIGKYVLIANNVAFVGRYDHNYQQIGTPVRFVSQIRDINYAWKEVDVVTEVQDDVWIGYGSIILSGVTIAKGCIIGAGSVVVKDTEEYAIYAGSPAKKIANRFKSQEDTDNHKELLKTYAV